MAYCWHGDMSAGRTGINTGLSVFNEPSTLTSSLLPVWQAEYIFTPVINSRKFLNKIAAEPKGYVAEGQWSDNTTTSPIDGSWVGEMFFLRTDKNGTPIWSRRLRNVQVMQTTHNAAFVIEGNSIYAVGFKQNTSSTEGVLVRIPLSDGAMDTSCAPLQLAVAKKIQYSAPETVANLDFKVQDSLYYYPINCTKTDTTTNCNQPCTDTVKLNADFALYGYLPTGSPSYFQVFANSFSPSPNSKWIVSQTTLVGPSYLDVPTTVYASSTGGTWATATTTQFGGYNGTVGPITESNTPTPTSFAVNQRYRFKHILSYTNNCGIVITDTVVKNVFMCPSCKGKKVTVETEKESSSGIRHAAVTTKNSISESETNVRLLPNPVSGSAITLEYAVQNNSPVQVNIQDMQGRKLVGKQFSTNTKNAGRYKMDVSTLPNGTYAMVISNNGKTITQKFVVAK